MVTALPTNFNFGNGNNMFGFPNTGSFSTNTGLQTPFGTPTQPQPFSLSFSNNIKPNGMFGNGTTAPAATTNVPNLFTIQPANSPPATTSATTPVNYFGSNNATAAPTTWNFFPATPPQQQQQAPQPVVFNTQPLQQQQQNCPPPIFTFSGQQQTPVQLQQPQQTVIQQVQPQQLTSASPPPTPLPPQSTPNALLYRCFIEQNMNLLIDELRKLESNQLFLGCPNSNPLVSCGTVSPPQYFCPQQPQPKLPFLPCDIGRPSTLALDYVQGVDKKLEAERNEKDFTTRLLWRNNHNKSYPLKTICSTESSMLLHNPNVRRSWGSTCLTDQYRDRHCNCCCCCSQYQLPDIWSPRYPKLLSSLSPLNDKNYLKQRTQSWRRGYTGYSYAEKDRRPQLNRFRMDGASFSNLDNLYLSQVRDKCVSPSVKDDVDKRWKTLDVNVVKESNPTRGQHSIEWDGEKRVQSLHPQLKSYGKAFDQFPKEIDPIDREDSQKIWDWFRQRRRLQTGPPLKSHLDDEDYDLYEHLRREVNKIRPEKKMVANLPKRFADWKNNHHNNTNCPIKSSTPSPPLLRPKIVKSTCRLLAPTKKRSEICREEVRTLYRNIKKGGVVTRQESSIYADGNSSVPLSDKTSPVFLTVWKNARRSTSSTSIQTDKPVCNKQRYNIGAFAEDDQNVREYKETREEFTQRLREMDPNRGRLRGRGPRIGEESRRTHDEVLLPSKEEPRNRPNVVTLSKPGYYCIPNIDNLNKIAVTKDWSCVWVKDFEIGHREHGKAMFPGYTNVYGLNLDEIVKISHKTFELYPEPIKEPPFGKGLNKPCTVTLYNVWPAETEKANNVNGGNGPLRFIRDPETTFKKFEEFLKRCCKNFNGTFLKYCPENGEWVFQVQQVPSHSVEQPVVLTSVDSNEDL